MEDEDNLRYRYILSPLDGGASHPSTSPRSMEDNLIVHFVRHAQGLHNLAFARTQDRDCYRSEEWADARLTDEGRKQCKGLRTSFGSSTHLDLVITSSLSRTVQTGFEGLGPANPDGSPRPFVALDLTRERSGRHPCDRRRPASELAKDFPFLDVSELVAMAGELDTYYDPVERESWPQVMDRGARFLRYLRETVAGKRGGAVKSVAVVTHNDWLQGLLLHLPSSLSDGEEVADAGKHKKPAHLTLTDEAKLKVRFGNAQVLSTLLTWERRENKEDEGLAKGEIGKAVGGGAGGAAAI